MLTVKIKAQNPETEVPTWRVHSVLWYETFNQFNRDGELEEWLELEDYRNNIHTVALEEGVTIYLENVSGKTIQVLHKQA